MATPSQNEYQRWHWARRGKYRDVARLILRSQLGRMRLPEAPRPIRAVVRFIRVGPRAIDFDNYVGGAKPIVDALRMEKILHDDSPRWVEGIYLQETRKPPHKTLIWVYPAIEQAPEA